MKKVILSLFLGFLFLSFLPGYAQVYETLPKHGNERGFGFDLSMSGVGFGGFYRHALPNFWYWGISADFFVMRDEKEFTFYSYYYRRYVQLNNVNRLFFIPINFEIKKRFFANDIEDNFRPHGFVQAGVIFGMNFPNKDAARFYGLSAKSEYQYTFNFVAGFGVDIGGVEKYFFSVRPQYRFIYFPDPIANRKNHSSFEIKIEIGTRAISKSPK